MTLKGRNFLKLMDYTPEEINYLIDLSAELKEKKHQGIMHDSLVGKNEYQNALFLRSGGT